MITKTFQLIKGLGPKTECRLWEAGFRNWYDVLEIVHPLLLLLQHRTLCALLRRLYRLPPLY